MHARGASTIASRAAGALGAPTADERRAPDRVHGCAR
jgi:hypothetical protein